MTTDVYEAPQADLLTESAEIIPLTVKQILFSFQGRIPRKAYWFASLGIWLGFIILASIMQVVGLPEVITATLIAVTYIAVLWASIAVQVKRWHDRNKSGWWVLINFVPVIGMIWSLVENGFLRGDELSNDYGQPSA